MRLADRCSQEMREPATTTAPRKKALLAQLNNSANIGGNALIVDSPGLQDFDPTEVIFGAFTALNESF